MSKWPQPCTECGGPSWLKGKCSGCRDAQRRAPAEPKPRVSLARARELEKFACRRCGRKIDSPGVCATCPPTDAKKTQRQRGYGYEHKLRREELLAALVEGTPCQWCGLPMYREEDLDADHGAGPGQLATRLLHAKCNRARGNGGVPIGRRYGPGVA